MSTPSLERINVNFPRPLLDDLRRLVPAKRRSEVIARATARELRRLKLASLFETLQRTPAWQVEQYPQLAEGDAIDRFVAQMRASGVYASPPTAPAADTRTRARRE